MKVYYRRKSDKKEFKKHEQITNGVILKLIDNKTGDVIGDKIFVNFNSFRNEYEAFTFEVKKPTNKITKEKIKKLMIKIVNTLPEYGINEDAEWVTDLYYKCDAIDEALFGNYKDRKNFEKSLNQSIRSTFPENIADEIIYSDSIDIYCVMYDLRNEIYDLLNFLEE